jgi:FAD/FMN-containing dehydrogenase
LNAKLITRGDANWDEARQAWNLAVDQQPAAVALPETAEDVVTAVEYARVNGLQVAPQGTGHNAGPLGPLQDTLLLKTSRMRGVEIDPAAQRARVEAGVIWIEVVEAAAKYGLAALAGSSPDVGVVGYSLGGGISWLARKYGLSANSVTAAEVVTADGRLVRADAENEPDLFWALRGGGGNFGAVTALEIQLYPIREVYAGVLFFPIERAREVLNAWREWIRDVPEEMTSVGRLLQLPPLAEIPEPLRGNSFVVVETIFVGDEAEGRELVAPLRELGPAIETVATVPMPALSHLHMDPEYPVPGIGEGMLLSDYTEEAIDAMIDSTLGTPLLSVEVRHLGGALRRSSPTHGAIDTIDADFLMFAVGITPTEELKAAVEESVEGIHHALAPWDSNRRYLNFVESETNVSRFYQERNYRRLAYVKTAYDPHELFRANHRIAPAPGVLRLAA